MAVCKLLGFSISVLRRQSKELCLRTIGATVICFFFLKLSFSKLGSQVHGSVQTTWFQYYSFATTKQRRGAGNSGAALANEQALLDEQHREETEHWESWLAKERSD
jgi:hypothetical protein